MPEYVAPGGGGVPFSCGCYGKAFDTLVAVEAEEAVVLAKEPGEFATWTSTFSHWQIGMVAASGTPGRFCPASGSGATRFTSF